MSQAKKGRLVCFEGIDGSGKSTTLHAVAKEFPEDSIVVTKQPGGTDLGKDIRQIVLHSEYELAPNSELLLFASDAAQLHQDVIVPAMDEGKLVLCDRGYMSNVIYQQYGRGNMNAEFVYNLVFGQRKPDLIFIFDVSLKEMYRRLGDSKDKIESAGKAFFKRIKRKFDSVENYWHNIPIIHLDGTLPTEYLVRQVLSGMTDMVTDSD